MPVSRRTLLTAGVAALACGRSLAVAQEPLASLIIELPDLPLHPEAPTIVAVNTSGFTSCAVAILDSGGELRRETREWSTRPDVSNGVQLSLGGSDRDPAGPVPHTVKVTMRPTRAVVPSMAMALVQVDRGANAARGAVRPVRGQVLDSGLLERAKQLARQARFMNDPASPPGGRFIATIDVDASLRLTIWKGETGRGTPILQQDFKNLPAGETRLPWDLTTRRGPVESGRYLATLLCTPLNRELLPIIYTAYFGVRMP